MFGAKVDAVGETVTADDDDSAAAVDDGTAEPGTAEGGAADGGTAPEEDDGTEASEETGGA